MRLKTIALALAAAVAGCSMMAPAQPASSARRDAPPASFVAAFLMGSRQFIIRDGIPEGVHPIIHRDGYPAYFDRVVWPEVRRMQGLTDRRVRVLLRAPLGSGAFSYQGSRRDGRPIVGWLVGPDQRPEAWASLEPELARLRAAGVEVIVYVAPPRVPSTAADPVTPYVSTFKRAGVGMALDAGGVTVQAAKIHREAVRQGVWCALEPHGPDETRIRTSSPAHTISLGERWRVGADRDWPDFDDAWPEREADFEEIVWIQAADVGGRKSYPSDDAYRRAVAELTTRWDQTHTGCTNPAILTDDELAALLNN